MDRRADGTASPTSGTDATSPSRPATRQRPAGETRGRDSNSPTAGGNRVASREGHGVSGGDNLELHGGPSGHAAPVRIGGPGEVDPAGTERGAVDPYRRVGKRGIVGFLAPDAACSPASSPQ